MSNLTPHALLESLGIKPEEKATTLLIEVCLRYIGFVTVPEKSNSVTNLFVLNDFEVRTPARAGQRLSYIKAGQNVASIKDIVFGWSEGRKKRHESILSVLTEIMKWVQG